MEVVHGRAPELEAVRSTRGRRFDPAELVEEPISRQEGEIASGNQSPLNTTSAQFVNVASRARRTLQSTRIRLLLKLGVPLLLLVLVGVGLRGAHLGVVIDRVLSASPAVLVLVLGLSLVQAASGAIRLWFVFPSAKRPRLLGVARAFSFGQLVNMYIPGRAGDAYKVVSIARGHERHPAEQNSRHASASIADTTGALLADRGLDVASLVLLCAVFGGSAIITVFAGMAERLWIAPAAVGLGAVMLALVRRFWPSARRRISDVVHPVLTAMRRGLSVHRVPVIVAIALVGWVAELVAMMLLASELGFHLSLPHAVVALLVLNLGIAVPVTVANVGAFETAAAVGLAAFGVPMPEGIAIGTVLHAGQIAAVIIGALVFWLGDRWIRPQGMPAAPPPEDALLLEDDSDSAPESVDRVRAA